MLAAAGWLVRRQLARRRQAAVAEGVVLAIVEDYSGGPSGHTYHPEVKFRVPSGEEVTFKPEQGSRPASYKVGQAVRVRYLKDRPAEAWIDNFMGNWAIAIVVGVFGAWIAFFGVGLLLKS